MNIFIRNNCCNGVTNFQCNIFICLRVKIVILLSHVSAINVVVYVKSYKRTSKYLVILYFINKRVYCNISKHVLINKVR